MSVLSVKSVAIVLLNYNSFDFTKECVKSLEGITYNNYKVIIVDNCSTDDSFNKLTQLESDLIHIIKSPKNGGFAFGNNIGIEYAISKGFDYVLLLNNDTIVEKNFLDELVATATREKSDITTCRIMYNSARNIIWYAGGEIDLFNQRAVHTGINTLYRSDAKEKDRNVTFISGCCMLLSRQCINKIGGLPEGYFMYYEDLDYCQNALNNHLKLVYSPASIIYHCVSASGGGSRSPFVIEWSNRSRRRFMSKYGHEISLFKLAISFFVCELREIIKIIRAPGRIKGIKAYTRSFAYYA